MFAALIEAIGWLFKSRIGLWIATAAVWLGVNFATVHIVIQPAIDLIRGNVTGGFGGGLYGVWIGQWVGVLGFDRCMSMVVSAVITKKALSAGRLALFKRGVGA
jgi:hypothetical protein